MTIGELIEKLELVNELQLKAGQLQEAAYVYSPESDERDNLLREAILLLEKDIPALLALEI